MLPLEDYWEALGPEGQQAYGNLIAAELDGLPVPDPQQRYGEAFHVCRRAEAYARRAGDVDLLQRALRYDLSHEHDHLRVIDSLRECNREREALAFAEEAVKRFPRDPRLRSALAECLACAGLQEESIEQVWQAFRLAPQAEQWDALKRATGGDWTRWRAKALEEIAKREDGNVTVRVLLLQHDGDLLAAAALARQSPVAVHVLLGLARQLESSDRTTACAFHLRVLDTQLQNIGPHNYREIVTLLQRLSQLSPEQDWRPLLQEIRSLHTRKKKLMAMLDAAGF